MSILVTKSTCLTCSGKSVKPQSGESLNRHFIIVTNKVPDKSFGEISASETDKLNDVHFEGFPEICSELKRKSVHMEYGQNVRFKFSQQKFDLFESYRQNLKFLTQKVVSFIINFIIGPGLHLKIYFPNSICKYWTNPTSGLHVRWIELKKVIYLPLCKYKTSTLSPFLKLRSMVDT